MKSSATRFDDEDFLLADAEEVVVERGALDDRPRREVEVRILVDDDGRVAGAAGDDALARTAPPPSRPQVRR